MSDVLLLRDAIDNLVDFVQGGTQDVELRLFKRCVREAYRDFVAVHPWAFFDREASLLLPSAETSVRLRYDYAANELKSSWTISNATDTTPSIITVPAGFAGQDGETISIANVNNVADGDYVLVQTGPNDFSLTGSVSSGPFVATGDEIAYRSVFTASDVDSRVSFGTNASYLISSFVDSWTLKLLASDTPGQDILGESATLRKYSIPLPDDFMQMGWITDSQTLGASNAYITPSQWNSQLQTYRDGSSSPFCWTILSSQSVPNRWEIHWAGSISGERRLSFIYRRRPADDLRWAGIEAGASSTGDGDPSIDVASTVSVTGTNTAFNSRMVGAYLRIGDVKADVRDEPTGLDGTNPYLEQHRIASVESATALTLETPVGFTGSGNSFQVGDLLDLSVEHYNAFFALCQKIYAHKVSDEDRVKACEARYYDALRLAMELDTKIAFARTADRNGVGYSPFANPRNSNFGSYVSTPFG